MRRYEKRQPTIFKVICLPNLNDRDFAAFHHAQYHRLTHPQRYAELFDHLWIQQKEESQQRVRDLNMLSRTW